MLQNETPAFILFKLQFICYFIKHKINKYIYK